MTQREREGAKRQGIYNVDEEKGRGWPTSCEVEGDAVVLSTDSTQHSSTSHEGAQQLKPQAGTPHGEMVPSIACLGDEGGKERKRGERQMRDDQTQW